MVYSGKEYDKIKKFIMENRGSLCSMCKYRGSCGRDFDGVCTRLGEEDISIYDIDKVAEYISSLSELT